MQGNEIWHEVRIKASPADVYGALTNVDRLGKWWIPNTSGKPEVGGILYFRVNEHFTQEMDVLAMEQDTRVLWQPRDAGNSDWHGSKIQFALLKSDAGTVVQVVSQSWWKLV